jgi:hypothetical protein
MKSRKFVLYENYLIDVDEFMNSHPGGRNLIQDYLYQDVGRYLTGTQAYNSTFPAHNHKYNTFKHIINKLAYAELIEDENKIVINTDIIDRPLAVSNKRPIAENTYEYRFDSDILSFARFIKGHEWIGRHFSVTNERLNKTRYYSNCLALDPIIRTKLNAILDNALCDKIINHDTRVDLKDTTSTYFNLYSKRYNAPEALSNRLFESSDSFHVKGPLGVGLNLKGTLRGTHVIFSAGTGIFPFIDLIALVIRYTVEKANNRNGNLDKNFIYNETFDIADDFKLVVFSAFANEASCVFTDECRKLKQLNDKCNLNVFDFVLRLSTDKTRRWGAEFMVDQLSKIKDNIEKIYIVGPVKTMDSIKLALTNSNLNLDSKVFLV